MKSTTHSLCFTRFSAQSLTRALFSVVVLCVFTPAHAQVFDAFLQPQFDAPTLPSAPPSAWLGDAELRLKPEFNNGSQNTANYSVRFRPQSKKQRRLDQQLFDIENTQLTLEWQRHYQKLVAQRYHQAVSLAEAEAVLWQKEQRRIADRSRVSTERALASGSNRFSSANSVQQAILQLSLSEIKVEQWRKKVVLLRKASLGAYFEPKKNDISLSTRLISPSQVLDSLATIEGLPTASVQAVQAAQWNSQHAIQRLALERSESRFGLSLLELGYDDKQDASYNLTLGFRIPSRRGTGGQARRARELIEAEQQEHLISTAYALGLQTKTSALRLEIESYQINFMALARHRDQLANAGATDAPAQQLLHEHELTLQSSVISQHARVLRSYVDLLTDAGLLYPATNNWLRGGER